MVKIATIIIAAALGFVAGYIADWPIVGMSIGILFGMIGSNALPRTVSRQELGHIADGVDMAMITAWLAAPALRILNQERSENYEQYMGYITSRFIPDEFREGIYNADDIASIMKATMQSGFMPESALARHNRKFWPTFFKKNKAKKHFMIDVAARLYVEAGVTTTGVKYLVKHATRLKIADEDVVAIMLANMERQGKIQSMVPYAPNQNTTLGMEDNELELSTAASDLLQAYSSERDKVMDRMFSDYDEQAAAA